MKRIRIAPGKFVTISAGLAEKAERVFASGLTRDQVRDLKASEPRNVGGLIAGSPKPLAIAKARARVGPKIAPATPVHRLSPTGALRRKAD